MHGPSVGNKEGSHHPEPMSRVSFRLLVEDGWRAGAASLRPKLVDQEKRNKRGRWMLMQGTCARLKRALLEGPWVVRVPGAVVYFADWYSTDCSVGGGSCDVLNWEKG